MGHDGPNVKCLLQAYGFGHAIDSQLTVLFWKIVEPLGSGA